MSLAPRWRKILRDIWSARARTALVVVSIAVGIFAFGTVFGARDIVLREMDRSYRTITPVSATLTLAPFDQQLVDTIARRPDIAAAQGRRTVSARASTDGRTWQTLQLIVVPDMPMTINRVKPTGGRWPPPKDTLVLEQRAIRVLNTSIGGNLVLDIPNGDQRTIPVQGTVRDFSAPLAAAQGTGTGYIALDTLAWFNEPRTFTQLQIHVAQDPESVDAIWRTVRNVERQLLDAGYGVQQVNVPTPMRHPAADIAPTVLLTLTMLGALSLILSGFLIINTITAILAQQTRQIGIMKAIGAHERQILAMYLGMALVFGILAVCLAVPLAALAAYGFASFLSIMLNFEVMNGFVTPQIVLIEIGIGLLVPMLTGLFPIRSAARQSVRAALDAASGPPPSPTAGTGWRTRVGGAWESLSGAVIRLLRLGRPLVLALRNTFRRRGRLIRTLSALVLAGGMYMATLALQNSVTQSLTDSFASRRYDATVTLRTPERAARLDAEALAVPGVAAAQTWQFASARPVRGENDLGDALNLTGLPPATPLLAPRIKQGRWLLPTDDRALVVSSNFLSTKEPGLKVGDTVALTISKPDTRWQDTITRWTIVGVSEEFAGPNAPAVGYVPQHALERVYGNAGRGTSVRVVFDQAGQAAPQAIADALAARYAASGIELVSVATNARQLADAKLTFGTLSTVLSILSVLMCVVGGLGLTGTMSINVLERTREIGVLRAVGASNGAIYQIITAEGFVIALLAWGLGALVSIPLGLVFCQTMGLALLNTPLNYTFSWRGVLIWLVIMLVVAIIASLSPARQAVRLTVREVLAYDG